MSFITTPDWRIIWMISCVVMTMSTSCMPSVLISGRIASNFFAVHGMMDTITRSSRFTPRISGRCFFASEPNICCGDLQEDRLSM